jgi:tripartite-type tricarboxylate transporter receptor subunit TctC
MTLFPRRFALALLATALPLAAQAQDAGPSKPIRIVVPYPAGGTTDQLARAIQQPMQELLGQPIVIDNKAGAGGTLGTDLVAKAPADGYTLVFGNSGPNATGLLRKLPYDVLKDFRPLSTVVTVPLILAVAADSPHKTVKDFVAWARSQGTTLNYGSTGIGGSSHLTGELFNDRWPGTKFQHIPYAGGAPLVTAFAGGQVHMAFVTGLDGAAMVQAGKIRYLAVAARSAPTCCPACPRSPRTCPASQPWCGSACWRRGCAGRHRRQAAGRHRQGRGAARGAASSSPAATSNRAAPRRPNSSG